MDKKIEKPVYINGKCFCQSNIEEVNRVFDKIAKKIFETSRMISVVI